MCACVCLCVYIYILPMSDAAGWPACGNTGMEYLYVDEERSFRHSLEFCNSLGGATLATPVNAEHYECIRHIKPPTKAIWTGIYSRTYTTQTWISVEDGSAVPSTQWNAQQPTTSPAKRCVQMLAHSVSGGGKWENTFCDMQLPAVCQRQSECFYNGIHHDDFCVKIKSECFTSFTALQSGPL